MGEWVMQGKIAVISIVPYIVLEIEARNAARDEARPCEVSVIHSTATATATATATVLYCTGFAVCLQKYYY